MTLLLQLIVNGLAIGGLYALIAVGFSLIFSTSEVFHLAHGATYLCAGYAFYWVSSTLHLGVVAAIVFSAVAAVVLVLMVDAIVYERMLLVSRSFFSLFVASFGVVIIATNVASLLFGAGTVSLGTELSKSVPVGPLLIPRGDFVAVVVAVLSLLILHAILTRTRVGVQLRALADNHELVEVVGLSRLKLRRFAMVLGSLVLVPAAILSGYLQGLNPHDGLAIATVAIAAALVGGVGNLIGACVAAVLLGLAENVGTWKLPGDWAEAIGFGLLLILLLVRPAGILASSRE